MSDYQLSYLDELESEAIYILREVYSIFSNPVILFSGGKDSIVVTHLAKKAFYPAKIPFSLLHIDTGHNFKETIEFRDKLVRELDVNLIVSSVQDWIDKGRLTEEKGIFKTRNKLQIVTLLDTIKENNIDCAIGGARRDEEKSRAKERIFSHRNKRGEWDPKNQRPELWTLYNGSCFKGEHFRVFPISNWTEIDVWNYIKKENIEIPSLYLAHDRNVIWRNNSWVPYSEFLELMENEKVVKKCVRFRTLGDITITGGIESNANTINKVLNEVSRMKITERGNRVDDKESDTSMEDRKRLGYF